ncbi:ASNA ATPase, partial [Onychorhynchus coronatus]|nr:ASNA ATPase [Onychorhynchus coronatus]
GGGGGGWAAEGPEEFEDAPDVEPLEPTLANIIEQRSLKWIFVGGKGGVGKTTCRSGDRDGLGEIGTGERQGNRDRAVPDSPRGDRDGPGWDRGVRTNWGGLDRLGELRWTGGDLGWDEGTEWDGESGGLRWMRMDWGNWAGVGGTGHTGGNGTQGGLVKGMNFSVVVFDTAPTGHTLRLLNFPTIVERGLGRLMQIKNQISPFISQMCNMLGLGDMNADQLASKLEETLPVIRSVSEQFKDP